MGTLHAGKKEMKQLSKENYYQPDEYMSVSQYKAFRDCSAKALAIQNGEWKTERTEALLVGSYVDAVLTEPDSLKDFLEENAKDIYKKNGDVYAYISKANNAIDHIQRQPLAMKYLDGEHQVIMTGEIEGVPVKIRMDTYKPGEFISDLKYLASLRSPNLFESAINYWGYNIQAAVYQEIVRQNTGERLPFYFVIATKEDPPKVVVAQIAQYNMDEAFEEVRKNIQYFYDIKTGKKPPVPCGDCDYCVETLIQDEVIDTDELGMTKKQRDYAKKQREASNG